MKKLLYLLPILLYFSSCTVIKTVSDSINEQEFKMLAKEKNKVFISSNHKWSDENKKIVMYATEEIKEWGYWIVTNKKQEADFILNIDIAALPSVAVVNISATLINPENKKAFKNIVVEPWSILLKFNTTKWSVKKIINKKIKPFVKTINYEELK